MKRCKRCIMPDTAQGIRLDENGICQLCLDYKEFMPKGEDALNKEIKSLVENIPGENCIVPVSGGRDSSYALYFAKEVLKLKPLAVHNDNDFESETATQNLLAITGSLDVPLLRTGSRTHLTKKIVVEKFLMNIPLGLGRTVDQTCEACKYGFESASYNAARARGIKVIFWGDSKDESTVPYHKLFIHQEPSKLKRYFSPSVIHLMKYKYYFTQMKKHYGPDSPDGLKEIHLYDYIRWDRKTIVNTIKEKLGWKSPEDSPTSWRVDCTLVPLINYLTEKAYGVSKIEIGFSTMVRSGKMDREEALKQVEQIKQKTDINQLKIFLKDLHIPISTINKAL